MTLTYPLLESLIIPSFPDKSLEDTWECNSSAYQFYDIHSYQRSSNHGFDSDVFERFKAIPRGHIYQDVEEAYKTASPSSLHGSSSLGSASSGTPSPVFSRSPSFDTARSGSVPSSPEIQTLTPGGDDDDDDVFDIERWVTTSSATSLPATTAAYNNNNNTTASGRPTARRTCPRTSLNPRPAAVSTASTMTTFELDSPPPCPRYFSISTSRPAPSVSSPPRRPRTTTTSCTNTSSLLSRSYSSSSSTSTSTSTRTRRSLVSSPWGCLEDAHHPLCTDCNCMKPLPPLPPSATTTALAAAPAGAAVAQPTRTPATTTSSRTPSRKSNTAATHSATTRPRHPPPVIVPEKRRTTNSVKGTVAARPSSLAMIPEGLKKLASAYGDAYAGGSGGSGGSGRDRVVRA